MKILITGATGKVGSRVAQHLAARGDFVRALVRDPAKAASLPASIERVKGDLLDVPPLERAVRGMDAVVHCAAFFRGATPEQAHEVNDAGTQCIGVAARAANVKRFVFTSTSLVYGTTDGRAAKEEDACAPLAAYPVSKLAAERASSAPSRASWTRHRRLTASTTCSTSRPRRRSSARRLERRGRPRIRRGRRWKPDPRRARLPTALPDAARRDRSQRDVMSSGACGLRSFAPLRRPRAPHRRRP